MDIPVVSPWITPFGFTVIGVKLVFESPLIHPLRLLFFLPVIVAMLVVALRLFRLSSKGSSLELNIAAVPPGLRVLPPHKKTVSSKPLLTAQLSPSSTVLWGVGLTLVSLFLVVVICGRLDYTIRL